MAPVMVGGVVCGLIVRKIVVDELVNLDLLGERLGDVLEIVKEFRALEGLTPAQYRKQNRQG